MSKIYLTISILIVPLLLFSQEMVFKNDKTISEFDLKDILKEEKLLGEYIGFKYTIQIPVFELDPVKGENYGCYEDLTSYIDFKIPSKWMIIFFKDSKPMGILYNEIIEILIYTPNEKKKLNKNFLPVAVYENILKSNKDNLFIFTDYYHGFWRLKNNRTYKLEYKIKKGKLKHIKEIPSGKYIAKEYGAKYIKSLVNDSIYLGIARPLCD